jgi:hypothetical protein
MARLFGETVIGPAISILHRENHCSSISVHPKEKWKENRRLISLCFDARVRQLYDAQNAVNAGTTLASVASSLTEFIMSRCLVPSNGRDEKLDHDMLFLWVSHLYLELEDCAKWDQIDILLSVLRLILPILKECGIVKYFNYICRFLISLKTEYPFELVCLLYCYSDFIVTYRVNSC